MKRLALLVGTSLMALFLVACGQNAQKKVEPPQPQEMMQEQPAPAVEESAPASEQAAPATEQTAPTEENK